MSVRRSLARITAASAATVLALTGLATGSTAAVLASPAARPVPQPQLLRDGRWQIASDATGTTLVWDSAATWLRGDARPEFALDGVVLGAPTSAQGGTRLQLFVPGLHGVSPSRLSVLLGGRRIDVRSAGASVHKPTAVTGPTQPTTVLTPDPGTPGAFRTSSFSYTMPSITVDGMPVPLEVVGQVVAPVGAPGRRPVVLFLHGRHSTCYLGTDTTIDWPCANGYKPIPSLAGYRYLQRLLASRGYVTVSIAANGINGQDGSVPDSGAHARSVLVRHHLDLLSSWNNVAGPGATASLRGRMDLRRIMLVGHSRGGEGVARASIDVRASDPYRIAGQVLVAPTDFGRQVASGVPTTVLLPYCDGDVSDLQGQQFVDQARGLVAGDHALLTSALVMGANHNYFNSEWTPGISAAPSNDDWGDTSDDTCRATAPGRLSAKAQRAVGAAYVSAAADTYLRASTTAVRLLDGTPERAASAGKAVVLTEALGGKRDSVLTDPRATHLSATKHSTAAACIGFSSDGTPTCLASTTGASPHWLQGDVPSTYALDASWTAAAATMTARRTSVVDLARATYVDLRVMADSGAPDSVFRLVLTDATGRSAVASLDSSVRPLPGSASTRKVWAQTVRVPMSAFTGIDLRSVRSVGLRSVSRSGHVYVLDAFASSPGQASRSIVPTSVPRFDVTTNVVTLPADDAVHPVTVTVNVTGRVLRPARLWLSVQGSGGPIKVDSAPGGDVPNGVSEVTIAPGSTSLTFTVPAMGSSLFSTTPDHVSVSAYPAHDAVVSGYVGGADVRSNVPAPTLSAVQPDVSVVQGQPIVWTLRLSAPTRYGWYSGGSAVTPVAGTELTTAGLLAPWVQQHAGSAQLPDGSAAPLSQAAVTVSFGMDMLVTTAVIEIPTARTSTATGDRTVAIDIAPDGVVVLTPLHLTAVVHPAP